MIELLTTRKRAQLWVVEERDDVITDPVALGNFIEVSVLHASRTDGVGVSTDAQHRLTRLLRTAGPGRCRGSEQGLGTVRALRA